MYKIINLLIPHRVLTLLAGKIAFSKINWLKNSLIKLFIRAYKPRMEEAIYKNPEEYESFNDFFTRELIQRRFISKNKLEIMLDLDKFNNNINMKTIFENFDILNSFEHNILLSNIWNCTYEKKVEEFKNNTEYKLITICPLCAEKLPNTGIFKQLEIDDSECSHNNDYISYLPCCHYFHPNCIKNYVHKNIKIKNGNK